MSSSNAMKKRIEPALVHWLDGWLCCKLSHTLGRASGFVRDAGKQLAHIASATTLADGQP